MRKLLYITGVVLLALTGVLAVATTLWLFTTRDTVSVNVRNNSDKYLENIVVSGAGFSYHTGSMGTPRTWAFGAHPQLRFDVHMAFDVNGQHYDLSGRTWLLPFGSSIVTLWVDEQLRLHADVSQLYVKLPRPNQD